MSAERSRDTEGVLRLTITDRDGDSLLVAVWPDGEVLLSTRSDGGGVSMGPGPSGAGDVEDGLALLAFLADALGVERYVPEQTALVVERARAVLALNATGSDAAFVEALEALANALEAADSPGGRP